MRRTSAPGCGSPPQSPALLKGEVGFTLIEMAVTLAVAVVIAGFALLNIRTQSGVVLSREANKLAGFMELVHDEAMTRGENLGVSFDGGLAVVWREDDEEWVRTPSDEMALEAAVENGVAITEVLKDGRAVSASGKLTFPAFGSMAPYSIRLALDGRELRLDGDIFGKVVVKEPGKAEKAPK